YYSALHPPFLPLRNPAQALVKLGEQLAKAGSAARRIQACDNCHGPGGAGEPPAIPYLAGQYAPYVALQLRMWQRGFRKNSPNERAEVAMLLNEEEIAAVAAYCQQVRASAEGAASR